MKKNEKQSQKMVLSDFGGPTVVPISLGVENYLNYKFPTRNLEFSLKNREVFFGFSEKLRDIPLGISPSTFHDVDGEDEGYIII
jgi:hypothetical protein